MSKKNLIDIDDSDIVIDESRTNKLQKEMYDFDESIKETKQMTPEISKEIVNKRINSLSFANTGVTKDIKKDADAANINAKKVKKNNDSNKSNKFNEFNTDDKNQEADIDELVKTKMLTHGLNRNNNKHKKPKRKSKEPINSEQISKKTIVEKNNIDDIYNLDKELVSENVDIINEDTIVETPSFTKKETKRRPMTISYERENLIETEHEQNIRKKSIANQEVEEIKQLIQATKVKKDIDEEKSSKPLDLKDMITDVSKKRKFNDEEYEKMKADAKYEKQPYFDTLVHNEIHNENKVINKNEVEDYVINIDNDSDALLEDEDIEEKKVTKISPIKKEPKQPLPKKPLDKNKVFHEEIDKGMPKFDKELKPLSQKSQEMRQMGRQNIMVDEELSSFDTYLNEQNSSKPIPIWLIISLTIFVLVLTGFVIFLVLK